MNGLQAKRKRALVTGASKGVGRGIAVGLASRGWNVGVNFHADREGAQETAAEIQKVNPDAECWVFQADVGDSSEVTSMFEEFQTVAGKIDLLVNNAGVQTWAPLLELGEQDWDRTIRTNLKGTFLCTQEAARLMKDTGGGGIVNIGSGANKSPFPNLVDYCASKGGIEQFTVVAAVELGPLNIRVNCVAPGCFEIERTRLEDPDYAGTWGRLTPLRRVGQVTDVANVVAYLASDEASFVTGQTLYVDGGLWSQIPWPYEKQ